VTGGERSAPARPGTDGDGPASGRTTRLTVYGCEPDEAELFRATAASSRVVAAIVEDPVSVENARLAVGDCCISVGHRSVVSASTLRELREVGVRHLSTRSVGVDHVDIEAASALGIVVEAVGYEPDGVADFTVMSILMAIRHTVAVIGSVGRHDFRLGVRGRDLRDLTVGVVGAGRIGRAVVRRLHGFGCRVLVTTRGPAAGLGAARRVPLDGLLEASDVVTLHVPLDQATRHLIGTEQLARMKRGAVLVNTGRGAVVDTGALLDALDDGRLGGAALDVLEGEEGTFYCDWSGRPLAHSDLARLLDMANVIVTPHMAFHTDRALHDTVERTLTACLHFERENHATTHDRDPVRRLLRGA
jgi:D-specific alpha-keto acid dehydrogenase